MLESLRLGKVVSLLFRSMKSVECPLDPAENSREWHTLTPVIGAPSVFGAYCMRNDLTAQVIFLNGLETFLLLIMGRFLSTYSYWSISMYNAQYLLLNRFVILPKLPHNSVGTHLLRKSEGIIWRRKLIYIIQMNNLFLLLERIKRGLRWWLTMTPFCLPPHNH